PGSILAITASRPGFREQHKSAALSPDDGDTEVEISFSLDRLRKTADLHGRVASKDGEALPDQAIYLRRGHQRHSATTNADGSYEFKGLETATNYILSVFPSQDYRDVERSPLELVPGDNRLDIELNPIEYATLSARVVGIRAIEQTLSGDKLDGDPVPALTLQIRSRAARAQRVSVTTDEEGKFRSHVPVGDLIVETRALPRITVRGLKIETGQELSAELPVGIGDHTLDGEVRSTNGRALPGVRLVATWTEKTKHLRTSLHLETKSDATGSFKFERLSPGTYSIQATGVGLKTKRVEAKVDDESKPISIEMR
ncbi:MAG: carboxypeptidase-like regulatory domain-containing protein, partial [Planctomycetota bacterium]